MRSNNIGGMTCLINQESIGGNAGSEHLAANFFYDRHDGKIIYFGNRPEVPIEIESNPRNVEGSFLILTSIRDFRFEIERIDYNYGETKNARTALALSAKKFNKLMIKEILKTKAFVEAKNIL